ncbi:hypothetical protein NLM33_18885 [Bradyrhizobium sp. CCGUVB1N3]|uniref:hypothetical protein n=1 Tax=Bradyrhizobium sp. CCGUVB1N3 TaxID=2949629 RepID=UPI0020B273E2|nr:hypothetical protein [Bradyrhizobium sp. CCGUVB1N3]MCP3471444.1 hypothetical protein [Bradyrhizobium sp. CCGUVB1N3]MCP3472384.1 hypothetical protein [Bradyrhizobium sp. CCGUVB1N3]
MSGVLIIGENERAEIAKAIRSALAKPMPWEKMRQIIVDDRDHPTNTLKLGERPDPDRIEALRREYPSYPVQLGSYVAAISFEEQASGLFRHLSISSRVPGKVPNEHAAKMVLEAFGFSGYPPSRPYRVWVEEYEPGRVAINFVELEPS